MALLDTPKTTFIINKDYIIQTACEQLMQQVHSRDSTFIGKTCYEYFWHKNSPCENCPVGRCVSLNAIAEENISLSGNYLKDERHAIAIPITDSRGDVRQVVVECLDGLGNNNEQSLPKAVTSKIEPPQSGDTSKKNEIVTGIDDKGTLLMNRDLKVLVYNPTMTKYFKINSVGVNLFQALPMLNQSHIRDHIEDFIQGQQNYIQFETYFSASKSQKLHHTIQRLGNNGKGEVFLIETVPHSDSHKEAMELDFYRKNINILSRFSSQVAHDIGNPLTSLMGYVNIMRNNLARANEATTPNDFHDHLDRLQQEINRMRKLLESIRLNRTHDSDEIEEQDIHLLVERAIAIAEFKRPYKNVHIQTNVADHMPSVYVCELNIENALSELLRYALEAAGQNGNVEMEVKYKKDLQSFFDFRISVNGTLDSNVSLSKMLHNFYSYEKNSKKINMELLKAFSAVYNHSGKIEIRNKAQGKAEISIKLPRVPSQCQKHET